MRLAASWLLLSFCAAPPTHHFSKCGSRKVLLTRLGLPPSLPFAEEDNVACRLLPSSFQAFPPPPGPRKHFCAGANVATLRPEFLLSIPGWTLFVEVAAQICQTDPC